MGTKGSVPGKWSEQGDNSFYSMFKDSSYKPEVRSPVNFALLKGVTVSDFVLDVDMFNSRSLGHQDLCLFFGYQDPSHFYYVHLGREVDMRQLNLPCQWRASSQYCSKAYRWYRLDERLASRTN